LARLTWRTDSTGGRSTPTMAPWMANSAPSAASTNGTVNTATAMRAGTDTSSNWAPCHARHETRTTSRVPAAAAAGRTPGMADRRLDHAPSVATARPAVHSNLDRHAELEDRRVTASR
jgi:hypothetical protein